MTRPRIDVGSVWQHGAYGAIGTVARITGDFVEMNLRGRKGTHFTHSKHFGQRDQWMPYNESIERMGGIHGRD